MHLLIKTGDHKCLLTRNPVSWHFGPRSVRLTYKHQTLKEYKRLFFFYLFIKRKLLNCFNNYIFVCFCSSFLMKEKNEALIEIKSYCTNIYILHNTQIFLWRHLPICFRWYMVCWDIKSVITVWKFSKRLNVLVFNQKMRLKNGYNVKQTRQQQKPAYCGSIVCGLTYCALPC